MNPTMLMVVAGLGFAALVGPRAARLIGFGGNVLGDRGSRASVRWLASRGAGVRQIARRTGLPQDVVLMLLTARNTPVPSAGRQNVPDAAGTALSTLPRPHSVKRVSVA